MIKPVAYVTGTLGGFSVVQPIDPSMVLPEKMALYSAPHWTGLTPQQLKAITEKVRTWNSHDVTDLYFAIESELKKKNGFLG